MRFGSTKNIKIIKKYQFNIFLNNLKNKNYSSVKQPISQSIHHPQK